MSDLGFKNFAFTSTWDAKAEEIRLQLEKAEKEENAVKPAEKMGKDKKSSTNFRRQDKNNTSDEGQAIRQAASS